MARRRSRFDYGYGGGGYGGFPAYVPVAERRAQAVLHAKKLTKKGHDFDPVIIEGRTIAKTFWGRAFCDHLGRFALMSNRLDRGRTYVRNGSVFHLSIERCAVRAMVSGSKVYEVAIQMKPAPKDRWRSLTATCVGHIGSLVELLSGKFDDETMGKLVAPDSGLLPREGEMTFDCSCPDGSGGGFVCKHVAATMFGVGARLDRSPELLFKLRDVDPSDLLAAVTSSAMISSAAIRGKSRARATIAEADLADVFGIDLGPATPATREKKNVAAKKLPAAKKSPAPKKSPVSKKSPAAKASGAISKRRTVGRIP